MSVVVVSIVYIAAPATARRVARLGGGGGVSDPRGTLHAGGCSPLRVRRRPPGSVSASLYATERF